MDEGKPTPTTPDASQLGKLLLMQSVLDSLPGEDSIRSLISRGLSEMPGVTAVRFCDVPGGLPGPDCVRFPLNVGGVCKGELLVTCNNPAAFLPYAEYVQNFCFMVAVVLEERQQRRLREARQLTLEKLVQERTRELESEVAERRRTEQQVRALLAEAERARSALLGILADQKRIEESLRESQERYALAERATQDGLWDWNILTDEEYFSPRYLEIIGLEKGELPGHKSAFLNRLHPEDLPRVKEITQQHLVAGRRYEVEFRLRHKDGGYRWVFSRGEAMRDATGRPIRMVGAITDITGRKRMEAEMQRVNRWLLSTQRISRVGGWTFNLQTGEVWVSPEAVRIYGAGASEPITLPLLQSFPLPQFRPLLDTALRELVAGRHAYDVEFQIRRGSDGAIADIHSVAEYHAEENTVLGVIEDITERNRAAETNARLAAVVAFSEDAIISKNLDGIITTWNRGAEKTFGYPAGEMVGASILRLIPTDRQTEDARILNQIKQGESVEHFETLRRTRDGRLLDVSITASPIRNAAGVVIGVSKVARDISGRKMAEAARENERSLLRTLVDHLPDMIYVRDLANRFLVANQTFAQRMGVAAPADLAGKTDADFYPPEIAARFAAADRRIFAGGAQIDHECSVAFPNGERLRILSTKVPLKNARGEVTGMVGVIHDITGQKLAEQKLRESEEKFARMFNSSPLATSLTTEEGRCLDVNAAFLATFQFSRDEVVGHTVFELNLWVHPEQRAALFARLKDCGAVHDFELELRTKSGQIREVVWSGVVLKVGGENCVLGSLLDITERRQLDSRMQQAQKMEAVGTLAGGIAHDFNNILAAMFGFTNLLQQDTEGNAQAQESLGEILKAGNRAKDLVQQILTFSRQREQKPQVIKLDMVIKEVMKFLRASLPAQINIEMNLDPAAPAVLADPTQIYQVAMNLATNALHAMEGRSGRLAVSLEPFCPDAAFLQTHREFKPVAYARLTVTDNGHGMDAKTLDRIFEPFFTTKPVGRGTGLGLAVVHGIVQSSGGVITVASEVGRGSTFCLYFPSQTETAVATAARDTQTARGQNQRILLLDDEPSLTTMLKRLLTRLNYQVRTSNSASEAVGWCRENPAQFDLLLTDLTMPEMNGVEVARQIHTLRPDLPVILMSGYSAAINHDALRAAGIHEVLEKPISLSALGDAVQRVLNKS